MRPSAIRARLAFSLAALVAASIVALGASVAHADPGTPGLGDASAAVYPGPGGGGEPTGGSGDPDGEGGGPGSEEQPRELARDNPSLGRGDDRRPSARAAPARASKGGSELPMTGLLAPGLLALGTLLVAGGALGNRFRRRRP